MPNSGIGIDPYAYKRLRLSLPDSDFLHDVAAPLEHRDFAREFVKERPILGPLSLTFAIPAYTGYRALFSPRNRTGASLDQLFGGFEGLFQGIRSNLSATPPKLGALPEVNVSPFASLESELPTSVPGGVRG